MDVARRNVVVEPTYKLGVRSLGSALATSNLHRPYGFGRNDTSRLLIGGFLRMIRFAYGLVLKAFVIGSLKA